MARRRMIDPNIWQSEDVSHLSYRQRLLLIGLFSNADDHGKGRGHHNYIRSTVFPYDDISIKDIAGDIMEIQKHIQVIFYLVDGSWYYCFVNWTKWQTVQKPQPSLIPDPPEGAENDYLPVLESVSTDSVLKEKKIKEEKVRHGDFVLLTPEEAKNLIERYGQEKFDKMVAILNVYLGQNTKNLTRYTSHYHVLLPTNWVHKRYEEEKPIGAVKKTDKPMGFYVAPEVLRELEEKEGVL